jgi:hypothetical protein
VRRPEPVADVFSDWAARWQEEVVDCTGSDARQAINSPLTLVALVDLRRLCNQRKGFHAGVEKKLAVETLRALHHSAEEGFTPAAIRSWAEFAGGWSSVNARNLGRIAEGVLMGRQFRGAYNKQIIRDSAHEQAMVARWRQALVH